MNLNNKGQFLIGIIIVLILFGLISGGLYYYFSKQMPEIPEMKVSQITEELTEEIVELEAIGLEEKTALPPEEELSKEEKVAEETPTADEKKAEIIYPKYLALTKCQGISKTETQDKIVALTFDDGPNGKLTEKILSILKEYDIKATFFVIGERAARQPELIKKIIQEGHVIGNHSYSHSRFPKLIPSEVEKELKTTSDLIFKITGKYPILFRPPYGYCSIQIANQIKEMGYKIITWSAMTNDWSSRVTSGEVAKDILRRVTPGGIIGLHDGAHNENRSPLIKALPKIIESLKARGYRFLTVPELLNVDPYL